MNRALLASAVLSCATLALPHATGHGGTYRGPGDTVPPGARGGTGVGVPGPPVTGGPHVPGTPPPSGGAPGTPGAVPGAPPGSTSGPLTGGGSAGDDLTAWDFWWGFNKDPYINLRAAIHASAVESGGDEWWIGKGEDRSGRDLARPTRAQIRLEVVPALLRVLETERDSDLLTGALIALAKIGDVEDESGASRFQEVFLGFLDSSNQEVAETAALALGILGHRDGVAPLVALMRDAPAGRRLIGKTQVPLRRRAFAAFGLGLIGYRAGDAELRADIAEELVSVLDSPHFAMRDLKVAAMTSLGLTPLDPVAVVGELAVDEVRGGRRHVLSRRTQLEFLIDYFRESETRSHRTSRHWHVRAHAPTAMARLLDDAALADPEHDGLRADVAELLLDAVGPRSAYSEVELRQSAILALGRIGNAAADGGLNDRIRAALSSLTKRPGDQQSKRYALIALGLSAGRPGTGERALDGARVTQQKLLAHLSKGSTPERPWAALALGVQVRSLLDVDESPDASVVGALRRAAEECRSPETIGGHAIALGLTRDVEATPLLLEKLDYFSGSDGARGYVALALGLIGDTAAIAPIQEILARSKYRKELLEQSAIALGLLGDRQMVPDLIEMLGNANGLSSQAAIASALGTIGDARSIEPLVKFLNGDATARARGFAAAALGIVCDKEDLPFNSKIAVGINYRANTVTLTGQLGTGVLDIL